MAAARPIPRPSMQAMLHFIQQRRAGRTTEALLREHTEERKGELAERASEAAARALQQEAQSRRALEPLTSAVEGADLAETARKQAKLIKETLDALKEINEKLNSTLTGTDKELEKQEALKAELQAHFNQLQRLLQEASDAFPHEHLYYEGSTNYNSHLSQRVHPNGSHLPPPSARIQGFLDAASRARADRSTRPTPADRPTASGGHHAPESDSQELRKRRDELKAQVSVIQSRIKETPRDFFS